MIEIKNLNKIFEDKSGSVVALKDVNLTINDGEIYGVIGMSGAGKSTLVRCINLLEKPSSGEVIVNGKQMVNLTRKELRDARREITMIFQNFNLLMQKTCLKNIMFPLELAKVSKEDAIKKAKELLDLVGLPDKADAYPSQLSGGQRQRIAIARALATNPKVLLCDEATSALDPNTTHQVLSLIKEINKKLNITCVVITHQMSVVEEICDKVAILDEGVVVEEGLVSEVFSNPKTNAAKKLVFPNIESNDVIPINIKGELIRVVFNGSSATGDPLIAKLALEKNICASILSASTRAIGDKIFGNMLIMVDTKKEAKEVVKYLSSVKDIIAKEVNNENI